MSSRITRRARRASSRFRSVHLLPASAPTLTGLFTPFIPGEHTEAKGGAAEAGGEPEDTTEGNADRNAGTRSVAFSISRHVVWNSF